MKPLAYQKIKFGELCENITQRIDDPHNAKTDYYVGLKHLDPEEPRILRHGSTRDVNATKLLFEDGDILFGRRRWYQRKIAVAYGMDGICSTDIMVLRPKYKKITKGFLQILMLSDEFYKKGLSISAGSLSPRIRWKELSNICVWIPSPSQQTKIIGLISHIDNSVAKTQALLEKLKTYKTSKADQLLSGKGLGHKKFKKVKWLFGKEIEIPEEWVIGATSEILKITMGQSPPSKSYNQEGLGLPFYQGTKDFGPLYPNPTVWCTNPKKITKANSILFSVRAPVGEINLTENKCCFGRGVAVLNPLVSDLLYCYYLVKQNKKQFLIYAQGTTYNAINYDKIANTKILYTKNTKEQQKIASILSGIDVAIKDVNDHLSKLKALRKGIINEKLTPPKRRNRIVQ